MAAAVVTAVRPNGSATAPRAGRSPMTPAALGRAAGRRPEPGLAGVRAGRGSSAPRGAGHGVAQPQHGRAPAGQVRGRAARPRLGVPACTRGGCSFACDLEAEPRGARRATSDTSTRAASAAPSDEQLEDAEHPAAHDEHAGRAEPMSPPGRVSIESAVRLRRVRTHASSGSGPARCRARRRRPSPRRCPAAAPRG